MPDATQTLPRWSPNHTPPGVGWARPGVLVAMRRGLRGACPCCGIGRLFTGWLRPNAACVACAAPLGAVRADDAPPYAVVFLVGHIAVGLAFAMEALVFPLWTEAAILLPLTLGLSLGLLRAVKGALIGLMLQLGMLAGPNA